MTLPSSSPWKSLPIAQRIAKRLVNWRDLLEAGAGRPDDLDETVARLQRSDTCCFIYTSGTGGTPKGVMLTHGSILCNCMGAWHLLKDIGIGNDVFLCFLPLSHAYEHTVGQFFPDDRRRPDLFRRERGKADRQHGGGQADDHDRRAAAL